MANREDSDIKIFKPSKEANTDGGVLSFVEGMNHHRQNGNVDKAKALGQDLANMAFEEGQNKNLSDDIFMSGDIFPQVCALILFSTEAALNYYLPSQQLSTIAINSLHETLGSHNLPIYEQIISSPAFSFYYLSVRKGGSDIPYDIGEAFAMLCRRENDANFIDEGKRLYTMVLKVVENKIIETKFSN